MAKDIFHNIVRTALENDGWTITHDPLVLVNDESRRREIDLGAEKIIAAERGTEKIAVEVKSFLGSSFTYEFNAAYGQYAIYKFYLAQKDPDRKLFLAVSKAIFAEEFSAPDVQELCRAFDIQILTYDIDNQIVAQWIGR